MCLEYVEKLAREKRGAKPLDPVQEMPDPKPGIAKDCELCGRAIGRHRFRIVCGHWYHDACSDASEFADRYICVACGEVIPEGSAIKIDGEWYHAACPTPRICGFCGDEIKAGCGTIFDEGFRNVHEHCYRKIQAARQANHEAEQMAVAPIDPVECGSWLRKARHPGLACARCHATIDAGQEYVLAQSEKASRFVNLHRHCLPENILMCGQCDLPIVDAAGWFQITPRGAFHRWCITPVGPDGHRCPQCGLSIQPLDSKARILIAFNHEGSKMEEVHSACLGNYLVFLGEGLKEHD